LRIEDATEAEFAGDEWSCPLPQCAPTRRLSAPLDPGSMHI
jgi:hypothetical protein